MKEKPASENSPHLGKKNNKKKEKRKKTEKIKGQHFQQLVIKRVWTPNLQIYEIDKIANTLKVASVTKV